jgi:hypothetical protein
MVLQKFGTLALGLTLTLALAGCIDARVDVDVLSETSARATITKTIGAEFYAMLGEEERTGGEHPFCEDGEIAEHADGSATCTLVRVGPFEELFLGDKSENSASFTSAGPGLVRVSFPTMGLTEEITDGEQLDAESEAVLRGFLQGHEIVLHISGAKIVESNMTMSEDERSAELAIPFADFITGDVHLPETLYAIVKVN